ncbi:MAG TPA: glycosyltransferase family 4 protein [Candidatus Krumholzibacteria bacterium]|nr:glycosyltransferase family 4 protein [Candidatus Krumholzibacteria bacterium]HPD72189.1 glycosyltransferase family 4 protein [Candidatus Krumholzibacteria bacterium]HRY40879.1 glycosyltransferase family 4 protein [Candidatus Krumholzibacteria bacterium]
MRDGSGSDRIGFFGCVLAPSEKLRYVPGEVNFARPRLAGVPRRQPVLRIAMLSSQREFYGGEVHLLDLAVALRDRGHRVACFVRPDSELRRRLVAADLEVAALPLVDWYEPVGMVALARRLRDWRPDILHTHNPRDYYIAGAATVNLRTANVGTRHHLRPIACARLKRPFLRRFAAMIAVSEAVRGSLLAAGLPARRVVTIPNGVRLPVETACATDLRRELGVDAAAGPVVGCVGRLSPAKGPHRLLWAAALLRRRWPGLQVVLIGGDSGNGGYARRLRELAADLRVDARFCGYRESAARLLPALDVLAVPSRAEPFGLVTVEALARGVPVVATRSGGSGEIVRDGRDGLLVPPDDPEALAAALHRMLADSLLRERCRRSGAARVAARFTLARQCLLTERVYAAAMAGWPPVAPATAGETRLTGAGAGR